MSLCTGDPHGDILMPLSLQALLSGLRADRDAIAAFQDRQRAEVPVYEVRLPEEAFAAGPADAVHKLVDEIATTFEQVKLPNLTPYLEGVMGSAWRSSVIKLSTALSEH